MAKKAKRRKKVAPASRGLEPAQVGDSQAPAAVAALAKLVERDGGAVIGSYRDPLGGHWQLIAALPIERVEPTPFQRNLSEAHLKRLVNRIEEVGRFLDPIIAVRRDDKERGGVYWTPNGNHRLHALRELGARSIVALLVPEAELAYKILALNTEKAHNLREKALEVIRMARDLAASAPGSEQDYEAVFEEAPLLTLGVCYEKNGRFSGGVYRPVLMRIDEFLGAKLPKALEIREQRAARLIELDEAVVAAVAKLKARGFESPYLKNFVVARINFLRFQRGATAEFDPTLDKLIAAAKKLDAAKVNAAQLATAGGAPGDE
jgi:ParB family chromosome partitioning protein